MIGGKFLVILREVNKSEETFKASRLLKEIMIFWYEDVYLNDNMNEWVKEADREINNITTQAPEPKLDEYSQQIATTFPITVQQSLLTTLNVVNLTENSS